MTIEGDEDLVGLARAGRVVAEARDAMVAAVAPGVSTGELDAIARVVMRRCGARSAPRLTYGFPGWTCISVNDEAAHGVPARWRLLSEGDIVNLDVSVELDGYFADAGVSVPVGEVSPEASHLLVATRLAQAEATATATAGRRLGDIGRAVEHRARRSGFSVITDLFGHGIGRALHESPAVPSFDDDSAVVLWEGLVLAIEPFLTAGAPWVVQSPDGWTLRSGDSSLVAQHEHTVVVTAAEALVLTA